AGVLDVRPGELHVAVRLQVEADAAAALAVGTHHTQDQMRRRRRRVLHQPPAVARGRGVLERLRRRRHCGQIGAAAGEDEGEKQNGVSHGSLAHCPKALLKASIQSWTETSSTEPLLSGSGAGLISSTTASSMCLTS